MKLYVDADITPKLARILRARGYDVLAAQDANHADAPDDEQMAYAVTQGRALLTCNAGDFTAIYEDYWYSGREHFGVIVSEQLELERCSAVSPGCSTRSMPMTCVITGRIWPSSLPDSLSVIADNTPDLDAVVRAYNARTTLLIHRPDATRRRPIRNLVSSSAITNSTTQ